MNTSGLTQNCLTLCLVTFSCMLWAKLLFRDGIVEACPAKPGLPNENFGVGWWGLGNGGEGNEGKRKCKISDSVLKIVVLEPLGRVIFSPSFGFNIITIAFVLQLWKDLLYSTTEFTRGYFYSNEGSSPSRFSDEYPKCERKHIAYFSEFQWGWGSDAAQVLQNSKQNWEERWPINSGHKSGQTWFCCLNKQAHEISVT